jgi:hypothetical protein
MPLPCDPQIRVVDRAGIAGGSAVEGQFNPTMYYMATMFYLCPHEFVFGEVCFFLGLSLYFSIIFL